MNSDQVTGPQIFTDLNKTAFIAGVAIASSLLWGFAAQILTFPKSSSLDLITTTTLFLFILMLGMALPAFLLVLSRTGITLSVSRTMQFLVQALIAVLVVGILIFIRDKWRLGILPDASRLALSANRNAWFLVPPGSPLSAVSGAISTVLDFLSRLLSVLFLVALAKQTAPRTTTVSASTRKVRKAAVIAIASRALLMAFGIFVYIVAAYAVRTYGTPGSGLDALSLPRTLLFETPALLVPWIVYRSIRSVEATDSC